MRLLDLTSLGLLLVLGCSGPSAAPADPGETSTTGGEVRDEVDFVACEAWPSHALIGDGEGLESIEGPVRITTEDEVLYAAPAEARLGRLEALAQRVPVVLEISSLGDPVQPGLGAAVPHLAGLVLYSSAGTRGPRLDPSALEGLAGLRVLSMSGVGLGSGATWLGSLRELRTFIVGDCAYCNMTEEELVAVAGLPSIERIEVHVQGYLGDAAAAALERSTARRVSATDRYGFAWSRSSAD